MANSWNDLFRTRTWFNHLKKGTDREQLIPLKLKHFEDLVWDLEHLGGQPFRSAVLKLTQGGTDAPVITILKNDLGELISERGSIGTYSISFPDTPSPGEKVACFIDNGGAVDAIVTASPGTGVVYITTLSAVADAALAVGNFAYKIADDTLNNATLEIRVYQ